MRRGFLLGWAIVAITSVAGAGDPKADCIAAADQGQQLRDDGKYRAARDKFVTCSKSACPKPVAAGCTQWLKQLDDGTPTVVLAVKDAHGSDVADVRVTFDGEPLVQTLDGQPIAVDPGPHKLRFEREGSEPVEQSVVVRAGEKLRAISVTLPDKKGSAPIYDTPEQKSKSVGVFTARNITVGSLVLLGGGALAMGLVFGLQAQSDADRAQAIRMRMPSTACRGMTSPDCMDLGKAVDAQNSDASISVVFWIVSGVLVASGIVALAAWPKDKPAPAGAFFRF
jgi:hypothetical protein